jgi:cytochrome c biogenesis protein CcmG, thiol:disulfide interchange protein DsbE
MEVKQVITNAQEPQRTPAEQAVPRKRSRKRNITIFIVVSVLNVGLLVLLWSQLLTPAANVSNQQSSGFGDSSAVGDINSPLIGKAMPDFTLATLDGSKQVHLATLKGTPLVLNFWASWCTGCQQEAPFLQKAQGQLKGQHMLLLGIEGQEAASAGQSFLQKYSLNYLNVHDTTDGTTAISYGVTAFPETLFINSKGIVVAKWIGALTDKGLQVELAKMTR